MPAPRRTGALKPIVFINTLLLTTAFTAPAFAQIEAVVVTAEKKAEDIQSVPLSVTALTGGDLSDRQITTFQDLQFNIPSVTNTKTNFTSSNFEIRGIGASGVGAAVESGVAFNVNDFYLNAPAIAETEYYDIDRIEVLRGPQSTLYGRNATGGSVNVITAKPDLDSFSASAEGEYGNYDDMRVRGAVNVPIVEEKLALRVSGLWWKRDGTTLNVYDNNRVDGRDQWSVRGALRFEPVAETTIDIMVQASREESSRMRSQKSLCHFDPSGVLGCLPDALAYETPNLNSTLGNISASPQTFAGVFQRLPASLRGYYDTVVAPGLGVPAAPGLTPGGTLFAALGLGQANLSAPQTSGYNPPDLHQINTDLDPTYKAHEILLMGQWKQRFGDWLDMTLLGGYHHGGVESRQSYYNTVGSPIIYSAQQIALIQGMAALPGGGLHYNTAPLSNFSLMQTTSIGGGLYTLSVPVSAFDHNYAGTIGGNSSGFSSLNSLSDKSQGSDVQKSVELRFNTDLNGPLNFLAAIYYMDFHGPTDYFVHGPAVDYGSLMLGALALPVSNLLPPGSTPGVPLAAGPAFYWNQEDYKLTSRAVFGEVYYDAIPDLLKFTAGLRYSEDRKWSNGRTTLYNAFVPVGTTNLDDPVPYISTAPFGGLQGADPLAIQITKNNAVTGRFVASFTPTLPFTEQTMIYASYSRGYKAGGENPPLPVDAPQNLNSYQPEFVNAFELGTKNTLFGGILQANMDLWYYDYKGLQVSTIVDKNSINENIDATMMGAEGEFLLAPDDHWQFNLNFSASQSDVGASSISNPRDPTQGDPNATLIKDLGSAENCVVTHDTGYPDWVTVAAGSPLPVIAPAAPTPGVSSSGFSSCSNIPLVIAGLPAGLAGHYHFYPNGKPINLKGNQLQNMPNGSIGFGVQYTQPIDGGYKLVGRFDGYWQGDMWGTIFNANPIDKISGYFIANAQVQLNAPEGEWYVRGFANNVFDKTYVTGMYVSDPATGAFTNAFVGQPRTYGVMVGVKF